MAPFALLFPSCSPPCPAGTSFAGAVATTGSALIGALAPFGLARQPFAHPFRRRGMKPPQHRLLWIVLVVFALILMQATIAYGRAGGGHSYSGGHSSSGGGHSGGGGSGGGDIFDLLVLLF